MTEAPLIQTDDGYSLSLIGGEIRARNPKGKELKSVPAAVKKSEAYAELDNLLDWLARHDSDCGAEVERWLLRSLPVPAVVMARVWPDESWQSWLRDLVIRPVGGDDSETGFLRSATIDVDGTARLGIVNLDGESAILDAEEIQLPHPALLPDLGELREFAAELGIDQRFDQLHRAVHPLPAPLPDASVIALSEWSDATFTQLRHATSRATAAGFAVKGGSAVTLIHEDGRLIEARYWIGDEGPDWETWTGDLGWHSDGHTIPIRDLGPVAYSEGVRMATHIHAGRTIEETTNE